MSLERIAKKLNREQGQYKLVSLVHHYPGIKGGVRWAVATNLSLEELEKVAEGELNIFKPFILITPEQGKAFAEFERLDKRLEMEELRHHSAFAFDEEVEGYVGAQFMHEICSGLDQEDALDAHIVRTALKQLSDKQQRRFRLFFYYGYSENEIARIEGVSQPAVHDSIQAGLKRLKYMLNW